MGLKESLHIWSSPLKVISLTDSISRMSIYDMKTSDQFLILNTYRHIRSCDDCKSNFEKLKPVDYKIHARNPSSGSLELIEDNEEQLVWMLSVLN